LAIADDNYLLTIDDILLTIDDTYLLGYTYLLIEYTDCLIGDNYSFLTIVDPRLDDSRLDDYLLTVVVDDYLIELSPVLLPFLYLTLSYKNI